MSLPDLHSKSTCLRIFARFTRLHVCIYADLQICRFARWVRHRIKCEQLRPNEIRQHCLRVSAWVFITRVSHGTGGRRLSLQLDTGAPCWGVLNMTGGVEAWSFAEGLPHSSVGLVSTRLPLYLLAAQARQLRSKMKCHKHRVSSFLRTTCSCTACGRRCIWFSISIAVCTL